MLCVGIVPHWQRLTTCGVFAQVIAHEFDYRVKNQVGVARQGTYHMHTQLFAWSVWWKALTNSTCAFR